MVKLARNDHLCHLGEKFMIDLKKIFTVSKVDIMRYLMNRNFYDDPVAFAKFPAQNFLFPLRNVAVIFSVSWNAKREEQKILFYADVRWHEKRLIKVCDPIVIIFITLGFGFHSIIKMAFLAVLPVG